MFCNPGLAVCIVAGMLSSPHEVAHQDAMLQRVESANAAELGPALQAGFEELMVRVHDYQGARARALAEALHARAGATWSAMSLALVCSRSGDPERAAEVLREALARASGTRERYELLERLGLALQAGGAHKAGLAVLGSAFARGSANAGVVLGRIALGQGQVAQARAIFRTLLSEDPPQSWALRGWGLSLLPAAPPLAQPDR